MTEPVRTFALATEESYLSSYKRFREQDADTEEVLTFWLGSEMFGIELRKMREIARLVSITELPRAPGYLLGIVTIRGVVIPAVDLKYRLRLSELPDDYSKHKSARILIVDHDGEPFGLVVDRVVRVVRVAPTEIEATPLSGGIDSEFLSGVARVDDTMFALLNIAAVVEFSLG